MNHFLRLTKKIWNDIKVPLKINRNARTYTADALRSAFYSSDQINRNVRTYTALRLLSEINTRYVESRKASIENPKEPPKLKSRYEILKQTKENLDEKG
jgi:hypothetical protein